jgi:hypothetical protein
MAVDFRGHPMFASSGFNAPARFASTSGPAVLRRLPAAAQADAADQAWVS